MRVVRVAVAIVALSGVGGCVYATKVRGPDGREAFRIHCQSPAQCADKANEVCAGDYQLLSSSVTPDGYANNGTGYANSPNEIVISCATGPAVQHARAAVSVAPLASAQAAPPGSGATGLCAAAVASAKEMGAFWSQLYPDAKRLDDPPAARDYTEVCRALPERVQRCLDARYRDAHAKPCLAVLKRLEPSEKNQIDSLFLE